VISITIKKKISIEEFIKKYEGERFEYIDGVPFEMQGATLKHGSIQATISGQLNAGRGRPEDPNEWLIITEAPVQYGSRYLFYHDLAGWKYPKSMEISEEYLKTKKPEWVCEILSQNRKNDEFLKKHILHEYRISYYWIVDPFAQILTVFHWDENGYSIILEADKTFKGYIPPFEGIEVQIDQFFKVR
jgi:Uma2 family endonuclease